MLNYTNLLVTRRNEGNAQLGVQLPLLSSSKFLKNGIFDHFCYNFGASSVNKGTSVHWSPEYKYRCLFQKCIIQICHIPNKFVPISYQFLQKNFKPRPKNEIYPKFLKIAPRHRKVILQKKLGCLIISWVQKFSRFICQI